MIIKKILPLCFLIFAAVGSMAFAFKGEKDPLHKRDFTVGLTEIKDGQPAKKRISDVLSFKNGTVYSEYLNDKFSYKWVRYRINKDSIYTDAESNAEVRLLDIEAVVTDEANTTLTMSLKIEDWDLEGVIKITKNDKPKKYFDVVGFEKGGKPKKMKKEEKKAAAGTMEEKKE
jgi:hypothetical protein